MRDARSEIPSYLKQDTFIGSDATPCINQLTTTFLMLPVTGVMLSAAPKRTPESCGLSESCGLPTALHRECSEARSGSSSTSRHTKDMLTILLATHGCTEVQIRAPTGELVVANSVEAGDDPLPTRLTPTLRGSSHGGHGDGCLSFTAKYGWIGGMNELGLGINGHALDLSVFQEPESGYPTLCKGDFSSWVLGLHSTVAEVASELAKIRLVGGKGGQWGVHDATGASIIVEYVKGEMRLHNNTVGEHNTGIGVMTNDPTWDWQLQNLNNYAALQPGWYNNNDAIRRVVPQEAWYPWASNAYDDDAPLAPEPIGHAYNLLGLPGDGSPPSRFVRVFFLRGYAMLSAPPRDLNSTLLLGQELLNSVYKVYGTIPGRDAKDPLETVPISTLHVTSEHTKMLYYRSRYDMTWRRLDLGRVNFGEGALRKSVQVTNAAFSFLDVTDELL